jgi:hypothetical protein
MATEVYGVSDDLIEFEGDVRGEIGCYGTDDRDKGVLVICDDGTLLEVKYGKAGMAVWAVNLVKRGPLFDRIEPCDDEDASRYSDTAYFHDGLKRAWVAKDWEFVE